MSKRSFLRKSAVSLAATLGMGTLGSVASAQIVLPPNLTIGVETITPGLLEGRVPGAFDTTTPNPGDLGIKLEPIMGQTTGGDNIEPWPNDITYIYTGQMNFPDNTGTGISQFAFAEHIDDSTLIKINGIERLRDTVWNVATTTGVLSLPAGWHDVEFRFGQGGGGAGPHEGQGWPADFGFGVDFTLPIDTTVPPLPGPYMRPVDNGSGNLFRTRTFNTDTSRDNQNVSVNADATLSILQGRVVPFGALTVADGTTFTVESTTTATFTQTNVGPTSTFAINSGEIVTGPLRSTGAVTSLTKTGGGTLNVSTGGGSNVSSIGAVSVNDGTLAIGVSVGGTSVGSSPINLNGGTLALANDQGVPNGPGIFSTVGQFYLDDLFFDPIVSPTPDSTNGVGWSGLDSKAQLDSALATRTPIATRPVNLEINFPRGDGNLVDGGTNDVDNELFNIDGANLGVPLRGDQNFVTRFTGKLNVTSPGVTEFLMMSNDGAVMFVDMDPGPGVNWQKVVDNNRHTGTGGGNFQGHFSGSSVGVSDQNLTPDPGAPAITNPASPNLAAGIHDYIVGWYNQPELDDPTPEAGIELYWTPAGGTRSIIPLATGGPITLDNVVTVSGSSALNVQAPSATLTNLTMNPGGSLAVSGNPLTTAITATGPGTVSIGTAGQPIRLTTLSDSGNAVTFAANQGRVLLTRTGGPGAEFGATSSVGATTGGTLVARGDSTENTLGGAAVTLSGGTLELIANPGITQSHVGDAAFNGTFIEDVAEPGTTPGSNYLVFRGLTATDFVLATTPLFGATARAPVNGIELRNGNTAIALKFGMEQPDGADGDDGNSEVNGPAGVNNTATWNNFGAGDAFNQPVPQPLNLDVNGTASPSGATVTWSSNNHWSSTGRGEENNTAPPGENRDLMAGYLDTGGLGGVGVTVNVAGLPASLTSGSGYDLYVYIKGGINGRGGDYTFGSSTLPAPNFASNVQVTENSTINVTGFTAAQVGNVSVDAGKTLTITGNRLKVNDASAGADGVVLFNSAQGGEVAGAIGGAGSVAVGTGTLEFTASMAMSTGTGTLDIRAPANFGVDPATMRFAPGAGNTHAAASITEIKNEGVLHAANGVVDLSGANVTTTFAAPAPRAGLIEITLNGAFNLGPVAVPADLNAATYTLELTSANTRDTDADRVYPTNSTQVYLGEIFIPDTDGNGRAGPIAFGEHFDDSVLVRIAGQTLLNNGAWNVQTDSGAFELPPGNPAGWYPFEARLGRGGGPNGHQAPWDDFGIGIDMAAPFNPQGAVTDTEPGGQADANEAAYVKPMDDGSMNLFRFRAPSFGQVNVDSGATLKLGAIQGANAVNIAATSRLELHGATSKIQASALSIAGTPAAPTGTLDVTDSAIVLDFPDGGPNPAADVRSQILAGRGGSGLGRPWNGPGITSSTAQADVAASPNSMSVGYAVNSEMPLGALTTFRGEPVDPSSVLIRYTRTADANLDGVVNDDDVTIVGALYAPGVPNARWSHGDFDYNGFVDDDDVTLLGVFYNPGATPIPVPEISAAGGGAVAEAGSPVAAVPEPSTWLMLTLGGLGAGLFGWRRRRAASAIAAPPLRSSKNDDGSGTTRYTAPRWSASI